MKNRIYFFTGTGNSLKVAQAIAKSLPDCELAAIHKGARLDVPAGLDRIGFVFPDYSGGPPKIVADFICNMELPEQGDTYLFGVSTYGGNAGSVTAQVRAQLKSRNWQLHYGATVWAYPNAVIFYPMLKGAKLFARISDGSTKRIIPQIVARHRESTPALGKSAQKKYEDFMSQIHSIDSEYHVNADCIACGICAKICPAQNIIIENVRPAFHHQCESCMACIQHCPRRAINYRDKTEKRGRYIHPNVGAQTIIPYYESED